MKDELNILLASADSSAVQAMQEALEASGRFLVCGNTQTGSAAVRELRSRSPDLLMLDLLLPELDEISALGKHGKDRLPPTLATSAFMSPTMVTEAQRIGVDALITKPYNPDAVVQRLIRMGEEQQQKTSRHITALEGTVTALIRELGVPAHIKGYQYIREAVMLTVEDRNAIHAVTKFLYPRVAQIYGSTPSRVERAIRHAIEVTWTRSDPEILHKVFSKSVCYTNGKPSNSEFIAALSDCIALRQKEGLIL